MKPENFAAILSTFLEKSLLPCVGNSFARALLRGAIAVNVPAMAEAITAHAETLSATKLCDSKGNIDIEKLRAFVEAAFTEPIELNLKETLSGVLGINLNIELLNPYLDRTYRFGEQDRDALLELLK